MASKHELIVNKVIISWSSEKKGRLFKMIQGRAVPLNADHPIDFGPLKGMKGFPDIFGWEYKEAIFGVLRQDIPCFCAIEVKTKRDTIRPAQKDFLDYIVSIGARAYIARENDSEKGYELIAWEGKL